ALPVSASATGLRVAFADFGSARGRSADAAVGRRMPGSRSVDAVLAQQSAQACGRRRSGGIPPGDRSHPRLPAQALLAPLLIEQHLLERAAIAVPLVEVLHLAVELAD